MRGSRVFTRVVLVGALALTFCCLGVSAAFAYGTIEGTVTEEGTGLPLADIDVQLVQWDGVKWALTGFHSYTDASGHYVHGTYAGSYKVVFRRPGAAIGQYYNGTTDLALAQTLEVTDGSAFTNIDAVLPRTGSISGKVTDSKTGTPIAGATVMAWQNFEFPPGYSEKWASYAYTAADGTYTIEGVAGDCRLEIWDPNWEYFGEWYEDKADEASADVVLVPFGTAVTGIDVELSDGARISGTVKSARTGLPIGMCDVQLWRQGEGGTWSQAGSVSSDAEGDYTFERLTPGEYIIEFLPYPPYSHEFYDHKATIEVADPISLAADQVVSGIDATLGEVPYGISGHVRADGTGIPLEGVYAQAWRRVSPQDPMEPPDWEFVAEDVTDADGAYFIEGLEPSIIRGPYVIWFTDEVGGHAFEWYSDAGGFESAAPVYMDGYTIVENIDASLGWGGAISGTVVSGSAGASETLSDIEVRAYRWVASAEGDWSDVYVPAWTAADGTYLIQGLRPGTYRIGFLDGSGYYAEEFYDDVDWIEDAESLDVTAGEEIAGVDAALTRYSIEDQGAGVTFDRWVTGFGTAWSRGTYVYGRWTNTVLEAKFTGSSIAWIGPVNRAYGKADVYIDNIYRGTADCYAPLGSTSAVIWQSGTLSNGPHTIKLRLAGAKNPASTGYVVVVDRFELGGAAPADATWRENEQGDYAEFNGTWIKAANPTYYHSTYAYSRWARTSYRAYFTGTKVAWIGPKVNSYGYAKVYIDGVYKATVDCYAPTTATGWRYKIWESAVLPRGDHYIDIKPTGTKRAAATNSVVVVDALDFSP